MKEAPFSYSVGHLGMNDVTLYLTLVLLGYLLIPQAINMADAFFKKEKRKSMSKNSD
jgi:hypothetical protein